MASSRLRLFAGTGILAAVMAAAQLYPHQVPLGVVVEGAVFGSVTGLLAVGLVLVYRTTRVVNFAYGAMGGLAGTLAVEMYLVGWVSWPVAIALALVVGVVIGVVVERVVVRRFFNSSRLVLTVATVGLAQVLGGAELLIPSLMHRSALVPNFDTPLTRFHVDISPVILTGNDILIVMVVPIVLLGIGWFLLRTNTGMAVRGIAENADRALLLGIPIRRLSTVVWAIVGGLAALTIVLKAPSEGLTLDAAAGPALLLPALAAAVVAGMTSIPNAFVAGLALGVIDQLARWNVSKQSVSTVVFLVVILLALLLRRETGSRAEAADESTWTFGGTRRQINEALAALPEVRVGRALLPGVVVLLAVALPLLASPSDLNEVSTALIYGAVAISLVVLTGWGGTVSLGQFAVVGVGGVVAANLVAKANLDLFLTMAAAGIAGGLAAVVIGLPALRVKGLFLAVTTLAFAVAMDSFFLNPVNFRDWIPGSFDRPVLWKRFDLLSERPMYYLCLGLLLLAVVVVRAIRATRTGRVLLATRDNPRAASAMAVPIVRARLTGFVIAGIIAGLAGALHAVLLRGVGFHTYEPSASLLVFSMAVIGGVGSITGALSGVALVFGVGQLFPKLQLLLTGAGLLVVLYALPGGLGQGLDALGARLAAVAGRRRGIGSTEVAVDDRGSRPLRPAAQARHSSRGLEPLLRCHDVSASYGSLQVLFGVDLDVGDGEIVALLGTNGAGKSTLLRTITGLVASIGGEVTFAGQTLGQVATDRIARLGLALMPGGRGLFPTLTVAENLRLACWQLRKDRGAAAKAVAEALDLFPLLRDRLPAMAGDLSGGQQQMLSLAMAFVTKPRLLCIDELSLGLSPLVVAQLCDKVREIHKSGTTIVLVEQSVNVALLLAKRAVFLEKGEVRFAGLTADLLDRPDLLRSVFIGNAKPRRTRSRVNGAQPPPARGVELSCTGLTKRFGGILAVHSVELTVAPGRITGLIGQNGAGKTTLFDMFSGFVDPDEGDIFLGGRRVTRLPPHRRAIAGLGRSFQEARLYPSLTVAETLKVALERHLANRDPVAAALALPASLDSEAGADQRVEQLLEVTGLARYQNHRTSELSTGTRRIVELGCILAQDPAVVLLDEPSAGIAQRETEALGPLLRQVQSETGCSMLIIEHDMGLVRSVCDKLIALDLGSVIAMGSPAEVLAHPRVIESYLGIDASTILRSGTRPVRRRRPQAADAR